MCEGCQEPGPVPSEDTWGSVQERYGPGHHVPIKARASRKQVWFRQRPVSGSESGCPDESLARCPASLPLVMGSGWTRPVDQLYRVKAQRVLGHW